MRQRIVRQLVAEQAAGGRLLNLFCYTGSATVQAAPAAEVGPGKDTLDDLAEPAAPGPPAAAAPPTPPPPPEEPPPPPPQAPSSDRPRIPAKVSDDFMACVLTAGPIR